MGTLLSGERAHVCLLRVFRWRTAMPREHQNYIMNRRFQGAVAPTRRRLLASVESLRTQTGRRPRRSPPAERRQLRSSCCSVGLGFSSYGYRRKHVVSRIIEGFAPTFVIVASCCG